MISARRTGALRAAVLAIAGTSLAVIGATAVPSEAALTASVVGIAATPTGGGYWLVAADGSIAAAGDARDLGSMGGRPLHAPIVGLVASSTGNGYWEFAADGGVFAFGDARFHGSMGGQRLNQPIVAMAATASGNGYWQFASDGGVFAFGDARFHGSMGGQRLNRPIVGAAATRTGLGYWLVASDGGVFAFGDARFHGSMGGRPLNQPIQEISAAAGDVGYRLVASDGGVFSFDAPFLGNALGVSSPVVGLANVPNGNGYWLATATGSVIGIGAVPDVNAPPPPPQPLASVAVRFQQRASGLSAPTAIAPRAGDDGLYVTERRGTVVRLAPSSFAAQPVLTVPDVLAGGERGLLGLTFAADGSTLYVAYTASDGAVTLAAFAMNGTQADPSTRRILLTVPHGQFSNHNGSDVQFGPDGLLYFTVGDGGGGGDPLGNGQNPTSLLGKVHRLDPADPSGTRQVVAMGLRNPWRIAFDRATGDLWIADVGQGSREEVSIDLAPLDLGRNYGWPRFEGTVRFDNLPVPDGLVAPLFEYTHANGECSISGGRVYRGNAIAGFRGAYVYGDFCSGRVGAVRQQAGSVTESVNQLAVVPSVVSFGEDQAGEMYAVSLAGVVYQLVAG